MHEGCFDKYMTIHDVFTLLFRRALDLIHHNSFILYPVYNFVLWTPKYPA